MWRGARWGNRNPLVGSVNGAAGNVRGWLTAQDATPGLSKGNLNSTSRCGRSPAKTPRHSTEQGPAAEGQEGGPGCHNTRSISQRSTHLARSPQATRRCLPEPCSSSRNLPSPRFSSQSLSEHAILRATPAHAVPGNSLALTSAKPRARYRQCGRPEARHTRSRQFAIPLAQIRSIPVLY